MLKRYGIRFGIFGLAACCGLLLFSSGAAAQEVTVGPQVRIDAGGTATANETTMASVHLHPNEAVGGWNDYRMGQYRTGISVSNDYGQTWTDMLLRPPAGHEGSTEGDPMTCYDNRTGTLWAGGMSWTGNGGVFVARKNPGASTFQPSVMTIVDGGIDKGWLAAGIVPGNPDSTRVYHTFNYGSQYSTDMGDTWTSPTSLGSGIGFLPKVGPGGELYVCYWDYYDGVMLRRSLNGGVSFGSPITIATRMDPWDIYASDRFPGTFRVPSLNGLAVDPNDGTLYCTYFDTTGWDGGNRNVDVYLTKSTNQGTTWSTPQVINGDSSPAGDQLWPWIEVDQESRLHVLYLDTRHTVQNDGVQHGMFDAYYALSVDGGASFTEYRLTPASFDSYHAGGASQFLGDYLGLGVGGDYVYPCYPSTQNGSADIFTNVITVTSNQTVAATMTCLPSLGILPFNMGMTVQLENLASEGTRRVAGSIRAELAGGNVYNNWRAGFTNLGPGEVFNSTWQQYLPDYPSLVGVNSFVFSAEDVTPAPFNQPPYMPSGDTEVDGCSVAGI